MVKSLLLMAVGLHIDFEIFWAASKRISALELLFFGVFPETDELFANTDELLPKADELWFKRTNYF